MRPCSCDVSSVGCGQQVCSGEMKKHKMNTPVAASSDRLRASTAASTINAIWFETNITQYACSTLCAVQMNVKSRV